MATGTSVLPFSRRREPVEVREPLPGEPVARTLDEAGFGPHVARLLGYPRDSPHGHILVAVSGKRLVGGACCASFGETGWIGALGLLISLFLLSQSRTAAPVARDRVVERDRVV